MEYSDLIHEMIVEQIRKKLSREFKEIGINKQDEKKVSYQGFYPDIVLGNHGMVLSIVEVETRESISDKQADYWKNLSGLGVKLILMIPYDMKMKVTDLLWNKGLMDKVAIGTYEISVKMP
jgi:hypothetical protein